MENQLEKIPSYRKEIEAASTLPEIELISDSAAAYAELLRRQGAKYEDQNKLGMERIYISKKQGELLNKFYPKGAKDGFRGNQHKSGKVTSGDFTTMPIAKRESSNSRLLRAATEQQIDEAIEVVINKHQVIAPQNIAATIRNKSKRQTFEQAIKQQEQEIESLTDVQGVYDVICIDPPWPYDRAYDPDTSRIANPYPEMSIQEIKDIELPLKENGFVFLWTTHRFLPDAFDILFTWGIDYKATLVWNKMNLGMGVWFRMQCEFCLFGVKGSPLWLNTTERDIINEPGREHSRKPEAFYLMVEKLCIGRKLDYFSRSERQGWASYGNRINQFYEGE
jgi:N6-adenosine-specific RNA methylase IME4